MTSESRMHSSTANLLAVRAEGVVISLQSSVEGLGRSLALLGHLGAAGLALRGLLALGDGGGVCQLGLAGLQGVGVQLDHGAQVAQRVLLEGGVLGGLDALAHGGLHFLGVDDTANVGVGHQVLGELVARLELSGLSAVAPQGLQLLEGGLGPHDQAAHVATGGQLQQVQRVHAAQLHTGQVAESALHVALAGVHHEGAQALHVAAVAELALAGAHLAGALALGDISGATNLCEDGSGLGGLGDLAQAGQDQGQLDDIVDLVAACLHQGGDGGGGDGSSGGIAALVHGDLAVPLAPGLGGGEHAALTAHVTERTLAGTAGSGAGDTRDTGHSAAGAPGLSRVLHAGVLVHGVWLATVLGHARVNLVHQITADGRIEHSGARHRAGDFTGLDVVDVDDRAGGGL